MVTPEQPLHAIVRQTLAISNDPNLDHTPRHM